MEIAARGKVKFFSIKVKQCYCYYDFFVWKLPIYGFWINIESRFFTCMLLYTFLQFFEQFLCQKCSQKSKDDTKFVKLSLGTTAIFQRPHCIAFLSFTLDGFYVD